MEFGRTDVTKNLPQEDTVVTSVASEDAVARSLNNHSLESELQSKPRGFFADQFEVRQQWRGKIISQFNVGRIEVTMMPISTEPVRKCGDKQMEAFMPSFLEQVIMRHCLRPQLTAFF